MNDTASKAKLVTAIAIILNENREVVQALKYRNISNTDKAKGEFYSFVKKKFPAVAYVNWYEKSSTFGKSKIKGRFIEKIYLQ